MSSHGLDAFVADATAACLPWRVPVAVTPDADRAQAMRVMRSALINAARSAAAHDPRPAYPGDHSWTHLGFRGLTAGRVAAERDLVADRMAPAGEEWGIYARVSSAVGAFDVPLVLDLDPDAARNILGLMAGAEDDWVDVDAVSSFLGGADFDVALHAGGLASLRDLQDALDLDLLDALPFRRPATWDLLRARLSGLPPTALPDFDEEQFHIRHARSVRYDAALMESDRAMVGPVATRALADGLAAWGEWFAPVVDLLVAIGPPVPMDGISVLVNLAVEEPAADGSGWLAVGFHNVVVCYGLHPLDVAAVMAVVLDDPRPFYDLPDAPDRRHRPIGASAVQDATLSEHRASLVGRTDAYERMVADARGAAPSSDVPAGDSFDDDEEGDFAF